MKRIMAAILATVMTLMGLTGCGKTEPQQEKKPSDNLMEQFFGKKQEPQPEIPETPELPGTLIGVSYATGGGMMAGSEFSIRLNRQEIEHTEFWPEEYADELEEREHVPITEKQWADVETVILALYQDGMLEAYRPEPEPENNPMDAFILDGGDYTNLSLVWETADGTEEIGYYWPGDRRVLTLIGLLQELADPKGREIKWYESPHMDEIYFTRDHRINTKRDYSFQLHYTSYDEVDPHWELIYYLGKHGAVSKGHVRLEEADWDNFVSFAEELQLEYFPKSTKSDKWFRCTLYYSDDTSRNILLNEETEQALYDYFMGLIPQ